MTLASRVYRRLPSPIQPALKGFYDRLHPARVPEQTIRRERREFVGRYFESHEEHETFLDELARPPVSRYLAEARDRAEEKTGSGNLSNEYYHDVYCYVREHQPDVVVETGVREGWSTLYILSGLQVNQHGTLYSVDYPIRDGEDVAGFVREAPSYEDSVPTIPAGTDPGWILPDELRDRWELRLGKSQRELPPLLEEVQEVDVFVHDSDHSFPCMMFEFELAWEWLRPGGIIFADDIHWNDAFDVFTASKSCLSGRTDETFGYVSKCE